MWNRSKGEITKPFPFPPSFCGAFWWSYREQYYLTARFLDPPAPISGLAPVLVASGGTRTVGRFSKGSKESLFLSWLWWKITWENGKADKHAAHIFRHLLPCFYSKQCLLSFFLLHAHMINWLRIRLFLCPGGRLSQEDQDFCSFFLFRLSLACLALKVA